MRWVGAAPGSPLGRVGRGEPGGGRTAPVGGPGAVAEPPTLGQVPGAVGETPTLGRVPGAVAETPTLVSSARRGNDGIWFIGERKEMGVGELRARGSGTPETPETLPEGLGVGTPVSCSPEENNVGVEAWGGPAPWPRRPALPASPGLSG